MKFKIVAVGEELRLLCCDGCVTIISPREAAEVIYHHGSFYAERCDDSEILDAFETYHGKHLVTLRDDSVLEIHNADFMCQLMYPSDFPYYTVDEFGAKHQVSGRNIRRLCIEGRIDGATHVGANWFIPKVSDYPKDGRAGRKIPSRRK